MEDSVEGILFNHPGPFPCSLYLALPSGPRLGLLKLPRVPLSALRLCVLACFVLSQSAKVCLIAAVTVMQAGKELRSAYEGWSPFLPRHAYVEQNYG